MIQTATPTDYPANPSQTTNDVVISIRNVSKIYPLYARASDRLKQSLWYALPSFLRRKPREFYREFWALRDVSFEVHRGETVGIIGRNGSGKSTLLQIIAGTLSPTHGEVQVGGRVAALLELGSGFNPEFTGRENVYLNGAILGFNQTEIDGIFDDIATFADIGQFIDQPVKLYSSGMMVRLAFAVQVMVTKEVLIVDEALAVGDIAFQRKCMRQIQAFQDNGGSILLVSHDLQMINRWCQRAVFMDGGQKIMEAESKVATDAYQRLLYGAERKDITSLTALQHQVVHDRPPDGQEAAFAPSHNIDPDLEKPIETEYGDMRATITDPHLVNEQGQRINVVNCGQRCTWKYRVQFYEDVNNVHFGMLLKSVDGLIVYTASTLAEGQEYVQVDRGTVAEISFRLDFNLVPGTYYFNCGVSADEGHDFVYLHRRVDVAAVRVVNPDQRQVTGIAYLNHQIDTRIVDRRRVD